MVYYNNIYNEFLLLTGAFGYFEVTNDITKYTKSTVFETIGKKTPVGMRFSTVGGESGSADTVRWVFDQLFKIRMLNFLKWK